MTETPPREMTTREIAWWKELKQVLRRQPKNIELHARNGEIGVAYSGARDKMFSLSGDTDRFYENEWDTVVVPRLDGRDSQL